MVVNPRTVLYRKWRRFKSNMAHLRSFARRFSRLGGVFLSARGQGYARWLCAAMLALCFAVGAVQVLISYAGRDFVTSLSNRDTAGFYRNLWRYLGTFALAVPVGVFYRFTADRLGLAWRKWMTEQLVRRYFYNRAYYHLRSSATIDNPDQRISEDTRLFTTNVLGYLLVFINSVVTLCGFIGVLWGISGQLVAGLVLYAGIGTLMTTLIGRRLVGLYFRSYQREGNFRYGLVRVRDNAESIAFFRGERREHQDLLQRFGAVVRNALELIGWSRNLAFFTGTYQYVALIVPTLVVGPMYMRGEVEFGVVTQAESAFAQLLTAVSVIVAQFEGLSAVTAGVRRLGDLWDYLDEVDAEDVRENQEKQIEVTETLQHLKIHALTVQTPDGRRTLARELSLELKPGESILIMGESGSGKSALLRTIAGLWQSGSGVIERPVLSRMMFLPQRPYMMQGNLREQLLYPFSADDTKDDLIKEAADAANLAEVLKRVDGDITQTVDWTNVLSLGEQQRVSFARLFLKKPLIACLDEATSALDERNERQLYERLRALGITYVSIGHRSTLKEFHDYLLILYPDGRAEISPLRLATLSGVSRSMESACCPVYLDGQRRTRERQL